VSTSPWSTAEFCYLCGETLRGPHRDNVRPSRVFPSQLRGHVADGGLELKTRCACAAGFQLDEEYFFTTLLLSQQVLRPFDERPGTMIQGTDHARLCKVLWKITRGLFSHQTQRFLPPKTGRRFFYGGPWDGSPCAELASSLRFSSRHCFKCGDYELRPYTDKVNGKLRLWYFLFIEVWETYSFSVWFHDPDCVGEECDWPEET
jgi:hypothetical protein